MIVTPDELLVHAMSRSRLDTRVWQEKKASTTARCRAGDRCAAIVRNLRDPRSSTKNFALVCIRWD